MFYEKYTELCGKTGDKPYKLAVALGAKNNSVVAQWKKGVVPRMAMLEKIAEHFQVSVGYLLSDEQKQPSVPEGLSEKDQRLIAWFRSLPEEKQKAILILQGGPEDAL